VTDDEYFEGQAPQTEPQPTAATVETAAEPGKEATPDVGEPNAAENTENRREPPTLAEALNGAVEAPGATSETANEGAKKAETTTGGDPWERYRDKATGLIHGRYKTAEDAVEALADLDRVRGQFASEIGELRDEMKRMFSGTDLEPQPGDPPRLKEACEAAKALPSKMRTVQAAVDYAFHVAGWTQEQIEAATPDDWKELRDEMRDGIRVVREEQREQAAQAQVQARHHEEQVFLAFETRHPDLAGRRELVDLMSNRLAERGYRRQGQPAEEFFDLVAQAVRNQLVPAGDRIQNTAPSQPGAAVLQPVAPPGYRLVPIAPASTAPTAPKAAPVLPGGGVSGGGAGKAGAVFVDDGGDFFNA